jgi:hypothetical protein
MLRHENTKLFAFENKPTLGPKSGVFRHMQKSKKTRIYRNQRGLSACANKISIQNILKT